MTGQIVKSLSGFYYINTGTGDPVPCRGRGKLRHQKVTPLVGDMVNITLLEDGTGAVDEVLPRKNAFRRPMVANIDQMVIVASGAIPVTDPFLIDRMAAMAEWKHCEVIICFNKADLVRTPELLALYRSCGYPTLEVSAETGEGVSQLAALLPGKVSAFTGNSGVGKSSLLNAINPQRAIPVGEVSQRLGRGRHTTRHVELIPIAGGLVADTPGFSSFDLEQQYEGIPKEDLADAFREFRPFLTGCRFQGCAHVKEKGCALLAAVKSGQVAQSRHQSYVRLYEQAKLIPDWEKSKTQ